MKPVVTRTLRSLQSNMLAGLLTIGPLFVTYLIFSFLFSTLAKAGLPLIELLAAIFPDTWIEQPWLQSVLAILLTLTLLYVIGRLTSVVIGRQAFRLFETLLERLPFVAKVYTSVRQLLDTMMAKKETSQRVVLVDFPIAGQKSIGFLTRTFTDTTTGTALAAVLLAQCHQSDFSPASDIAFGAGYGNGFDHGAGDEHVDDGRSGGAGIGAVFVGAGD